MGTYQQLSDELEAEIACYYRGIPLYLPLQEARAPPVHVWYVFMSFNVCIMKLEVPLRAGLLC